MTTDRYLYNKAILCKLSELVEKYPEQRFTQLLWNMKIFRTERCGHEGAESRIVDTFNEESRETWKLLLENRFVFPPNENA